MLLIGQFVFGETYPETGCRYNNSFEVDFSKEKNFQSWRKVGYSPLTRACLEDTQVRHEVGAGEDEDQMANDIRKFQSKNYLCVYHLKSLRYKGDNLQAKLKEKNNSEKSKLTLQYSMESIKALYKCTTHGDKFLLTGGMHLSSNDGLKADEMDYRKNQAEAMNFDRKVRQALTKKEKEAVGFFIKKSILTG